MDWNISLKVFYDDFIPYAKYWYHGIHEIRDYGLWQVQGVDKQPLNTDEYQSLKKLILG